MEELNDDSIIDSINLNSTTISQSVTKEGKSNHQHHGNRHRTKNQNGHSGSGGHSKKSKKLPWNCEVIRDRFTPQPYPVQLVERYLETDIGKDVIVLSQNAPLKQYLLLAALQLHQQKQVS